MSKSVILPEKIMRGSLFDNQNLLEGSLKTFFCMHASLPRFVGGEPMFISAIHPAILGRCAKKLSSQFRMIFKYQNSCMSQLKPNLHIMSE